jgi:malonyl CoA-acyl carrier protein transacylase
MSKDNSDQNIKSLVDQLKESTIVNNNIANKTEELGLQPEDVEQFVIKNSGHLVQQSLEVMDNVKDYIMASGDPDSISALSDLINASSKAIESLNKLVVQNKRSATTLASKSMDIEAKYTIEDTRNKNALIGTREDIFKKVLAEAKVIEIKDENIEDSNSDL